MTREELLATAEVLRLVDQLLTGMVTYGDRDSIERYAITRTAISALADDLEIAAGYPFLPDIPLQRLRSRADRLRSELAQFSPAGTGS